mmetsp:Transcript_17852/g.52111  ORF Transcript_17852/g.52111 Transcript_17852/m.52111 type:complete len:85 (-) Transcript_17852:319-573(-)
MGGEAGSEVPDHLVGLGRWEAVRAEWVAYERTKKSRRTARTISHDEVIDCLFSPQMKGRLPQRIPLPQMIAILVDFWEADGLFD